MRLKMVAGLSAKTNKDRRSNTERQKENRSIGKKMLKSCGTLAGDAGADAELERIPAASRGITARILYAPRSLAARPDCTGISNALTRWILLDSYFTDFIELPWRPRIRR